ncbi:hypothetical protein [Parabacteroides pacaensis]|uniref:hypothetical protein n=1 Tax=Parabacteroides pacaensis TaxID=2086575 RepID=UPI000D1010A5|nr:hypothetical protein [Parabacteroides pacaensis]
MKDKEQIEMNIADTIIERPITFSVSNRKFFIYHSTLGKTYLLVRLLKALDADDKVISVNPYMEALRLCQAKKGIVCRILSYCTFNSKEDVCDNSKVECRAKWFERNLDNKDLATLFVLILSGDNTDEYINYFGIDREREKRKRIAIVKKNNSSISFGGNSMYGTLIDFACQRYGWTMDYVVWGISYANLKMLMADAITTVCLSAEERKQLHIFDDKEYINADDPKNKELIRELLKD